MKKIYFLLLTLLISTMSFGQLVINEIDSDTPGTDTAEFIELKWTPNTSLNGYIVVLFNGSNDLSYATIDLTGKSTDANGFFIIANESLATGDDIVIPAGGSGFIQNGADAVAIYQDLAATFPNGTAPTAVNLIDALVYGTSDPDDTGLLTGLGETFQYDENANAAGQTQSIQYIIDGSYITQAVTFRAENDTDVCGIILTSTTATCDAFTAGVDTYTATVAFSSGGASASYVVSADSGTVGGDDPALVDTGIITVTGVAEGTDVVITVTDGGLCDLSSTITSPTCLPSNTLPLYEPFNYTVGSNLGDQPNWTNINTGDEVLVGGPGGLSYPDLAPSTGNHVAFGGIGIDPGLDFTPVTTGVIYASFIFTVTDQTAVSNASGGYFAALSQTTASYDARLWVKPNPDASSTTFDIGIENTPVPAGASITGPFNVGDAIFVVMSYDLSSGAISGWLNPSSASFGGTAPAPSITAIDASASTSIDRFILRQDSASETPSILFDELRIGSSWADVTPTTLSNDEFSVTNFKIFPNPTSAGFVNITSTNADAMSVAVFDVLGKQVINKTISNNRLDVSSLKSGLYIVKISQNNATVTKKLVIK